MSKQDSQEQQDIPQRLGRYRIIRRISTGGMAWVYEARREAIEGVAPRVALKVILPQYAHDGAFRQLFVNEARIGSMLRHQNICQVQDFDADENGLFFLVMEYVEGVTLRKCIRRARKQGALVPLSIIAEIGRQVCDGLHHAHSARNLQGQHLQLVHRDLKPSNLMLNPQGVVKLLDFGISKAQLSTERPGAVRGTWGYMAPEQAAGAPVGPPADLFGLASVLYELASLQPLFSEKEPDVIRELLAQDEAARRANRLSGQHAALGGVLVRALQRDPQARYPSAAAMGRALGALTRDPLVAREKLVRFQQFAIAAPREASTPRRGTKGGADAPAGVAPGGLPLRVGDVHRPAPLSADLDGQGHGAGNVQQLQAILFALFIGASAGTLAFTAWKVYSQRSAVTTAVDVPTAPAPSAAPSAPPPPTSVPEVAEDVAVEQTGTLSIDAQPIAQVELDGTALGQSTPVDDLVVSAGRHTVTLVAETGERTTFSVDVDGGETVQRVWSFDEGDWVTSN